MEFVVDLIESKIIWDIKVRILGKVPSPWADFSRVKKLWSKYPSADKGKGSFL